MAQDQITRHIWCNHCNDATEHLIDYRGTTRKGESYYLAVFYSKCKVCAYLESRGFKEPSDAIRNEISVSDYNALMSKELYADYG